MRSIPQQKYEKKGKDRQTKGRDDEICWERMQGTSDRGNRFQYYLEQPRGNIGIMETSKKG